jgi:hydroxymethylglutaryl-CoA reductase
MGANVVNAVAEGMADRVAALAGGRVGLRILSNLAVHRRASVRPPTTSMRDNDSRE